MSRLYEYLCLFCSDMVWQQSLLSIKIKEPVVEYKVLNIDAAAKMA